MGDLHTTYSGKKSAIFKLALVTGVLTLLSAGLYRFWMKTRLRRYYWSAVRPGGVPMEYIGDPWEKLLGFLFAVVILAFYIGVVNLLLMFFSFTFFSNNIVAYGLSFVGILPLIFFAQYRARRYVLARTRWRGIRFGLEPGAWGYTWRAALYWLLTLVSAGILWPLKAFKLEKYRIDRTFYGDQQMHQGGRWTMLLGAMKHVYIGGFASAALILVGTILEKPELFAICIISGGWLVFGLAYWRAHAFRRLTDTKTIGGVGLKSQARGGRVLGIYMGGYILTWLTVAAGMSVVLIVISIAFQVNFFGEYFELMNAIPSEAEGRANSVWVTTLIGLAVYFAGFLYWGAASHTFITLPMARHFAETLQVTNPTALTNINQRARDEFSEAEGFADALDVGAAL